MSDCKPMKTPMNTGEKFSQNDGEEQIDAHMYKSLIGSLLYLTNTRPDIMYATSLLSRFMQSPSKIHLVAAKRVLRYLKGTITYGISYTNANKLSLCGFSDSDWAGSVDDRKSTFGYIFTLGSGAISWSSKKQSTIALSSSEAEYVAVTAAACHAIWLRRVLEDLKLSQKGPTTINCDNQSTIAMTKNPVFHQRTKHIELRHHFVRELVTNGSIELQFCNTKEQLADIFTKALPLESFLYLREKLGVSALRGSVEIMQN